MSGQLTKKELRARAINWTNPNYHRLIWCPVCQKDKLPGSTFCIWFLKDSCKIVCVYAVCPKCFEGVVNSTKEDQCDITSIVQERMLVKYPQLKVYFPEDDEISHIE